jgi:hypothetical protein
MTGSLIEVARASDEKNMVVLLFALLLCLAFCILVFVSAARQNSKQSTILKSFIFFFDVGVLIDEKSPSCFYKAFF